MASSVIYLLGELASGYTQYPVDGSSNYFMSLVKQKPLAPAQMIIHRENSLMYYVYLRQMDPHKCIGIGLILSNHYFTDPNSLFSIFESTIEQLIEKGVIINFTPNGQITSNLDKLNNEEEEVLSIIEKLRCSVDSSDKTAKLPPLDFSIAKGSKKIFRETDSIDEIANDSQKFDLIYLLKESDYDNIRVNSFKNILKNLSSDKDSLIIANNDLRKRLEKIQKEKKQVRNVVLLTVAVLVCGFIAYTLHNTLNSTRDNLNTAKNTISSLNQSLSEKQNTIHSLENDNKALINQLNIEREQFANQMAELPFIIFETQVLPNWITLSYINMSGIEAIQLTLRVIQESTGDIFNLSKDVEVQKGKGEMTLSLSPYELNSSRYYYVLVIHNGQIIAGKRW